MDSNESTVASRIESDWQKLLQAVRGSKAALVLYEHHLSKQATTRKKEETGTVTSDKSLTGRAGT